MKIYHLIRKIENTALQYDLIPYQDWSKISPVFIISTGRTGTKFLADFYNYFPNVVSRHEPYPDFLNLGIDYAQGLVSFETAVNEIEKNRRVICRDVKRRRKSIYIEANNRLFSLIKPLMTVFPEAKIVYIVRDGRDYVRSGMSRAWYKKNDPSPRLRADMFPNDPYYSKWSRMTRFEKIAWRWQKKDSFINNDFEYTSNSIKVKFEEIFDSQYTGLLKICNFIGLPDYEVKNNIQKRGHKKINTNATQVIPKWHEWENNTKRMFDEIAGEHMKRHYPYQDML